MYTSELNENTYALKEKESNKINQIKVAIWEVSGGVSRGTKYEG